MAEPIKEHQVTTQQLGSWELDGVLVTQSQSGTAVTWSFDFSEWLARQDRNHHPYFMGYLSHEQATSLAALLNEEAK